MKASAQQVQTRLAARPTGQRLLGLRIVVVWLTLLAGMVAGWELVAVRANLAQESRQGSFEPTIPPGPAPEGMVWIPGGPFSMDAADPKHRVEVAGFYIDKTVVTNKEFARFVDATGYVTVAERKPREALPGGAPEKLADWRHPLGLGSRMRDGYPVVHVAYEDAVAYAEWAGKRLPTEGEWEFVARGGLTGKPFVWGDEARPPGKWTANNGFRCVMTRRQYEARQGQALLQLINER